MINAQKTKLMTRAVRYEKSKGSATLFLHRNFSHGIGIGPVIKNFAFGFAAFVLIALLVFVGYYFSDNSKSIVPESVPVIIVIAAVSGIALSLAYSFAVCRYSRKKYENVRSSMREYDLDIHAIEHLEQQEEEESEVS